MQEEWVPLLEYAVKNDVSLSTLRRYIKSNRITYRVENGRYLVLQEGSPVEDPSKIESLEKNLKRAQQEITELQMLVSLYEEKISSSVQEL